MSGLSFGQLEACLAHIGRVAYQKRYTFQSRLKQWQKMGFPAGTKVGRGTRVSYTLAHLFQLVLMMQLLRLGLTPERSIKMVNAAWPKFRRGLLETIDHLAEREPPITYAIVHANALAELEWGGERSFEDTIGVDITNDAELTALWYGINEADEDDEAAIKAEEDARGYSSEAWVEWLRMSLADSLLLELNVIVMAVAFAVAQVAEMDPAEFADEIELWRAESKRWEELYGEEDCCRVGRVLKRDTHSPTWRNAALEPAALTLRRLTGRLGDVDIEELRHKLDRRRENANGDHQET